MLPIAHQGGWDEALIFVVPVLLYAAIRLWDRRRGDDDVAEESVQADADTVVPPPPPGPRDPRD